MDQLPDDFADSLARVLEPGEEHRIAEIIEAATQLDDDGLRMFLGRFAARVSKSAAPIKAEELIRFLHDSKRGGRSGAT